MFEIHVGELRATFLRNHNMRRRKRPQAEDNPSRRRPHPRQPLPGPAQRRSSSKQKTPTSPATTTSTGALHPIRGTAPVTWRCTRTEEVHCLRIGCTAPTHKNKRGTGTPNHSPPHPSMRSWVLLAAGWARGPRRHLHSSPLRHLLHPYMRRAGFRVRPLGCGSRGDLEGPRDAEVAPLAQEVITPHEGKRAQRVRQPRQPDIRSAAAV